MVSQSASSTAALSITGMNCASCVAHVSKAVRSLAGVDDIAVNLARGRATVTFDPVQTSLEIISARITESGYPAQPESTVDTKIDRQKQSTRSWLRCAIVGFSLWLPVEIAHWTLQLLFNHAHHAHMAMIWIALATSTLCLIYVGSRFFKSAWNAATHRTTNMDTLIAMGSSVAYFYSLIYFVGGLFKIWPSPDGDQLYFMESSALLALISLGHWLEANAKRSAGSAIRELMNLAPATAWLVKKDEIKRRTPNVERPTPNEESSIRRSTFDVERSTFAFSSPEEISVSQVQLHDALLIHPGDRIPIDGIVIDGTSSIDESMITGEPQPVTRTLGDAVIGGTINQDGRLVIRTTAIGSATALSQIVQLVEKAQDSRPPVQRLADQIAAVFVPAVLGIALFTAISWYAWGVTHHWSTPAVWAQMAKTTCAVLLIACPCALGLAVPAAIMVGTGLGARRGILIRDIDALQKAEKIDTVVLDKTGTLTQGKPVVTSISGDADVLRLAAAAEQFSSHPIAKAIMHEARQRGIEIPHPHQFNNQPGYGLTAELEGRSIIVGNQAMLDQFSEAASIPPAVTGTIVYVAEKISNGIHLLGRIEISDSIKPDSANAIAKLHAMGLTTALLTGDNLTSAAKIAQQVQITAVHADLKPGGKSAIIQKLQNDFGQRVAMVGDGINDAPALAQADLGIALGSGSDIAKETGDIVLISGSLMGVAAAIVLSKATMRTIRQNLFFAFIYNVLAIPLAALGFLHPIVAAAAMALSDVTVIGNSLRLRWMKIDG